MRCSCCWIERRLPALWARTASCTWRAISSGVVAIGGHRRPGDDHPRAVRNHVVHGALVEHVHPGVLDVVDDAVRAAVRHDVALVPDAHAAEVDVRDDHAERRSVRLSLGERHVLDALDVRVHVHWAPPGVTGVTPSVLSPAWT